MLRLKCSFWFCDLCVCVWGIFVTAESFGFGEGDEGRFHDGGIRTKKTYVSERLMKIYVAVLKIPPTPIKAPFASDSGLVMAHM